MTALRNKRAPARFADRAEAEAYVASVCFKHGPPRLFGVELEWTVHHAEDPAQKLDRHRLAAALGEHAPPTLVPDSPQRPLPSGTPLTVEPGGQVEISTPPCTSLPDLFRTVSQDISHLTAMLADHGLVLGERGSDLHRRPTRVLQVPRYAAMEHAFGALGQDGISMMCNTAGLQVCLDFGEQKYLQDRWAAVHQLGPVMIALFANSPSIGGMHEGWASARMRTLYGCDPVRTRPSAVCADPALAYARRVVDTPVIVVRGPGPSWIPPRPMTFVDWMNGAHDRVPTSDDLDYHMSLMFPPVRPRGYMEIRYLDTPAPGGWIAPSALLVALFSDPSVVDGVLAATERAAGRWLTAARHGMTDARVATAAKEVVALGIEALPRTGLSDDQISTISRELEGKL
ncbi:glutamate-cysteine ligase family protein [Lentzea sp. NPDC102401]|uniref:glutamate-cysteine ligase family protein n=1 Tax=Lentzea sp. NPDC102401 TaxID=3364128 RepID=UPI003818B5C1